MPQIAKIIPPLATVVIVIGLLLFLANRALSYELFSIGIGLLVLAMVGLGLILLVKYAGSWGWPYVITSHRALVLDRNYKIVQECHLQDVEPVAFAYSAPQNIGWSRSGAQAPVYSKGDVQFVPISGVGVPLVFHDILFPDSVVQLVKAIQRGQANVNIQVGAQRSCNACFSPLGPTAAFCPKCGARQ